MASKTYIQHYADGTCKKLARKKQGRKPSGLGKPKLIRLFEEQEEKIKLLKLNLGIYWNESDFIREAVTEKLNNSIYTELVKT